MITLRSRVYSIGVMIILAVAVVIDMHDRLTAVQNTQGVTSQVEPVQKGEKRRYMGVPPPPDCQHLYNNGHSWEWRECMGVGRK